MFLNIKISKATPEKALKYATGKNILETTKTRNLISDKSPAQEMRDTAARFGKWQSAKDRKTFSLVISPAPKDNPTREQVMEITEAVLDHFFPTIQGIIVLHKDKGRDSEKTNPVLHSHFYGSIIDPTTGKNIHLSDTDVRRIRAWADEYAKRRFNWKPFTRGTQNRTRTYKRALRNELSGSGRNCWFDSVRNVINEAYEKSASFGEFCSRLGEKGISVLQESNTKDLKFEFLVNGRKRSISASTLGEHLSWNERERKFIENNNRRCGYGRSERTAETYVGNTGYNKIQTAESGTGQDSRQGYVGKHGIDFGCILCTQDKDICKYCADYRPERGDNSHGSRTR